MESLKTFPLGTLTSLSADNIRLLESLKIKTVQSLASRIASSEAEADSLRIALRYSQTQMDTLVEEIRTILPDEQTGLRSRFASGALLPHSMEWQVGQTEGLGVAVKPEPPCDCHCHDIPRTGFYHCFSPCKCGG